MIVDAAIEVANVAGVVAECLAERSVDDRGVGASQPAAHDGEAVHAGRRARLGVGMAALDHFQFAIIEVHRAVAP